MAEAEIFKLFALVMVRFSGLMIAAPVLGSANFPVVAKIGLTAMAAMLITPTLPALETPLPDETLAYASIAVGELLIGLAIGFAMTVVFAAIQLAGQIIDLQTGFGMMNVFNPAFEVQFPVFGFFLFILAVLYLLAIDGHHLMVRALVATYDTMPLGEFSVRPELLWNATRWGKLMFVDGLMLAAPVATAMLLAYITMGIMGRLVPQIHLFVVGFPLTIAMGLIVMALSLGIYLRVLDGMFVRMFREVEVLVRGLG